MALGFIKKIFSFGKKEVDEVPAEAPAPALEAPVHPTIEQVYEDTTAQEALPVPGEAEPVETKFVEPVPVEEPAPVAAEPEPEPVLAPIVPETILAEPEPVVPPVEEELPIPFNAAEEPFEQTLAEALTPPVHVPEPVIDVPAPVEPVAPAKPASSKVTVTRTVEEKKAEEQVSAEPEKRLTWFERLRKGLARSSQQLGDSIGGIFTRRKLDEDTLQDLEDVLIQADLGMETAIRITGSLSATRYGKDISSEEVRTIMATEIEKVLGPVAKPLELDLSHKPHVILVVGVNGTGKTTTIGKLAAKLTAGGLSVMLAAGDTFRAAAIEQLHIWGKRTGAPVVSSKLGADAAGLAYDAWKQAKEAGSDVLIIDTAGRLQNRTELMDELAKIVRVLGKNDPEAPHTVLQTLDATTGQNALNQVEIFKNIAGVNGLVMTKLDGTARGGILVAISAKHKLPVYFIGVGEQVDDLEPFAAKDFAKAIAGVA
ncbi:signal recognition particle-docking protein FtsY [Phyllobacterium sp. 22229]|uniref:signal recognition particle-docking protein FtsY n=1 Tax=Phyllobacterium sp. 22229 TaxID=3453895 RepID=UPI003F86DF72